MNVAVTHLEKEKEIKMTMETVVTVIMFDNKYVAISDWENSGKIFKFFVAVSFTYSSVAIYGNLPASSWKRFSELS